MRRWLIVIICLFVVLTIFVGLFALINNRQTNKFELLSSNPADRQTNFEPTGSIVLNYSKPIKSIGRDQVRSTPQTTFDMTINGSVVTLKPIKTLAQNTQYLLTLNNVTSESDQKITTTITFTTGTDNSPRARFLRTLPHFTDNYAIYYNQQNNSFTVQLLKLPLEQAKSQALQYFRDQGVNATQEDIQFNVIRSLLGSGAPPG